MTCTRTLLCDGSARPTTHCPAHTLQIQSRCYILTLPPNSSTHLPCLPPQEKQQKLNYRRPKTETAFFTHAEGKKKHIAPCVLLRRHPSLSLSAFFLSIGSPFQTRDPSYSCPAAWNHVNAPLLLPLSHNKMIHFSITAMSVWNELYNQ